VVALQDPVILGCVPEQSLEGLGGLLDPAFAQALLGAPDLGLPLGRG